jgi:thiol:disulfide interchange protein DsbC
MRRSALAAALIALVIPLELLAQEAAIRKAIAERMPDFPKVDEISKTPIPGLYELRIGTEVIYSDETGSFIIQGSIFDTKARLNLTEERIDKLTAIDFKQLPLADAIVWKQGTGERKIAVFEDPNCSYCRKFERDLNAVKNVTVYMFLYPILGPDSAEKSRQIWCAKDRAATWRAWMLDGTPIPRVMGQCDTSALQRNVALGKKHRVNGTPAIVFEDGKRIPGAVGAEAIEKQLLVASRGK